MKGQYSIAPEVQTVRRQGDLARWLSDLDALTERQLGLLAAHGIIEPTAVGSRLALEYERFVDLFPDPRMRFMNHGYTEEGEAPFAWGDDAHPQPYAANLVRRLCRGLDLTGARVLDVGCGRGGTVAYLSSNHEIAAAVGVDFSEQNVAFCRRHPVDRATFLHGDAHALPVADASFDAVFNIESSHCYPNPAQFLREVRRVLVPGGVFAYADCVMPGDRARVAAMIRRCGLRLVEESDITGEVARGLRCDRPQRERLMRGMIDPALGNGDAVEKFLQFIEASTQRYRARELLYFVWRLHKD